MNSQQQLRRAEFPGPKLVKRDDPPTGSEIQIENGNFTRIHNVLLEALYAADYLSGLELRLLLLLLRQTYGWNRKSDTISYSQFAEAVNTGRRSVRRYLKRLESIGLIQSRSNGQRQPRTWALNKYIEEWPGGEMTPRDGGQMTPSGGGEMTPRDGGQMTPHKRHSKDSKERGDACADAREGSHDPSPPTTNNNHRSGQAVQAIEQRHRPATLEEMNQRAVEQHQARQNRTHRYPRQRRLAALNERLPVAVRKPLAEKIAALLGKSALIDVDDKALYAAHEAAIAAHQMGYTTVAQLERVEPAWRDDWRCSGATARQLLEFLSEHLEQQPSAKSLQVSRILE